MILKTIKTNVDQRTAYDRLNQRYECVGSGSFGEVFAKSDRRVIKMGYTNSDHYIPYVKHVGLNSKNPHFPRIYSVKLYDTNPVDPFSVDYYTVEMERLFSLYEMNDQDDTFYDRLNIYYDALGTEFEFENLNISNISYYVPKNRHLVGVKNVLRKLYADGAVSDLRPCNIMYRYDENTRDFDAVLTDPCV